VAVEYPDPQEIELGPPKHLALEHFESVHMALDDSLRMNRGL